MPKASDSIHKECSELLLNEEEGFVPLMNNGLTTSRRGLLCTCHLQPGWLIFLAGLLVTSILFNIKTLFDVHAVESDTTCRPTNSNLKYHVKKLFEDENDYLHDTPLAAELWRNMSLQGLPVALSTKTVQRLDLEPSQPFPWDTDRHLYYVKSFHQLHCLKLIRHALIGFFNHEVTEIEKDHLLHCVETFRQDVMCDGDDTFLPYNSGHHLGAGKHMVCRDWKELQDWATQDEFDACWDIEDDYRPVVHPLERFGHCKPNSRYRSIQERYFELHGHRQTFEEGVK